nr:hypothetical protein [uncultured Acinetobacter sp.]
MADPDENCLHFSTTLFNEGKATCFGCGAIVSEDRKVLELPKYVLSGLEQMEIAVKNANALSILQGQRFNEQTQYIADLEYKARLCVSQLFEKFIEANTLHATEEAQAFDTALNILCNAFNLSKPKR